jgi:hypothetical protein
VDTDLVDYGVAFDSASTHIGWTIEGWRLATSKYAIATLNEATVLYGLSVAKCSEVYTRGIYSPGTITGFSDLRLGPMPLDVAKLADSYLQGYKANWKIGELLNCATASYG